MTWKEWRHLRHIGFALYGYSATFCSPGGMYEWALGCFDRLGCKPDIAGFSISGKSDGKYRLFRNLDKKLRASGYEGLTSWELVDVPDELSDDLYEGQLLCRKLGVSFSIDPYGKGFVLHLPETQLIGKPVTLLELAREACEQLKPKYRIVFHRLSRFGPMLYGLGMSQGGRHIEESEEDYRAARESCSPDDDNMNSWRTMDYHDAYTLLRSVYPWNFLTQTQLDISVNGVRLVDWIRADTARGTLGPFTEEMTLWTVPEDRVRPVRDELWEAGVVLDRKRHFHDVMDEYHVGEDVIAEHYKTGKPLVKRPRGPGLTAEQMLSNILGAFGDESSEVLRKEPSGELKPVKPPKPRGKKKK